MPVLPDKTTGYPGFVFPARVAHSLICAMENAAIAHEPTPCGVGDDLTRGEDAVLKWARHWAILDGGKRKGAPQGAFSNGSAVAGSARFNFALPHDQRSALEEQCNRGQCGQKREDPPETIDKRGNGNAGSDE